ncbi:DUF2809 domain-containing protein [Thalassotalea litorea]|uniref:DUF2809 domain-containing protein n=1 Tax=Thalassotalea litorea TaxID=2020715 RepID=A0A5R9ICN1_9GAMM|nr:DUF2809 domain-containing protein [Thalassotalea litorea]
MNRRLLIYGLLTLSTVGLGLLSRSSIVSFPDWVNLYLGDFLWGLMVFWLACIALPSARNTTLFLAALTFAFLIEISQIYQAPWINELRHTSLGALVLGFGFKWSDLIAYTLGIALGAFLNHWLRNRIKVPGKL